MRPPGWDWDIYRGKIIVEWDGEPHWGQLLDGMISLVPRYTPNDHDLIVPACALSENLSALHEIGYGLFKAIMRGIIELGEPLTERERERYRYVRYGRVAVAEGIVHVNAPDLDFGEGDHICHGYLGVAALPPEALQELARGEA